MLGKANGNGSKNQANQQDGKWLFEKQMRTLEKLELMREVGITRKETPYFTWDVPLSGYAFPLHTNFEKFVSMQAESKASRGIPLFVFDAGIGSGKQWLPLMKGMEGKIELYGSNVLEQQVVPELAGRVVVCQGSSVHQKFPQKFDIAVSRHQAAFEELEAMLSLSRILVPGGYLFMVGDARTMPERETIMKQTSVALMAEDSFEGIKAYWLLKR
ncbi:MAG: hypothetical protein N3F07_00320 [Candidatus Micrarchaeota archaeon]|nr:hypothetical protein [Candidatus Micrarchaeota archaeon]